MTKLSICIYGINDGSTDERAVVKNAIAAEAIAKLQIQLNKLNRNEDIDVLFYFDNGELSNEEKRKYLKGQSKAKYHTFVPENFEIDRKFIKRAIQSVERLFGQPTDEELAKKGIYKGWIRTEVEGIKDDKYEDAKIVELPAAVAKQTVEKFQDVQFYAIKGHLLKVADMTFETSTGFLEIKEGDEFKQDGEYLFYYPVKRMAQTVKFNSEIGVALLLKMLRDKQVISTIKKI